MEKGADYQISSSVNDGVLEIVLTGEVTNDDFETINKKTIAIQKSMDVDNELLDVRTLNGRLGIVETYNFARNLHSERPKINIAFVDIVDNVSYNSIHEAPLINAGLSFKCFTDIGAARDWLKSKQEGIHTAAL
ncbi:MAG: hypothetical protein QMD11_01035 [Smithella sp.]|nr:hypothetical protein [Smithella sp.]